MPRKGILKRIEHQFWCCCCCCSSRSSEVNRAPVQSEHVHSEEVKAPPQPIAGVEGMVKVGPWGAAGGTPWDISDCSEPQRLVSISINSGDRIYGFSFSYVDQGGSNIPKGPWVTHGSTRKITMKAGEHVNHVSGTADSAGVTSLKLATNQSEYGPFGVPSGTAFSLPLKQDRQGPEDRSEVVSFFGRHSDMGLVALGVYILPTGNKASPLIKVGPWGRVDSGQPKDLTRDQRPVKLKSFTVRSTEQNGGRIYCFSHTYEDQNGNIITVGPWGSSTRGTKHPMVTMKTGEYVRYIGGTYDDYDVTSLEFQTTQTVYRYGCPSKTAFSVPLPDYGDNNGAAVAFFGHSGESLAAFGAYLGLAPKATS